MSAANRWAQKKGGSTLRRWYAARLTSDSEGRLNTQILAQSGQADKFN